MKDQKQDRQQQQNTILSTPNSIRDSTGLLLDNDDEMRVNYRVIHVSSEDPKYPASKLVAKQNVLNDSVASSPSESSNEGWQSHPNCTYPQIIILQPVNNNNDGASTSTISPSFYLTKMKILTHNCKIPQKIDIYTSHSPLINNEDYSHTNSRNINDDDSLNNNDDDAYHWIDNQKVLFQRMGCVKFENNAKTKFRARELKSITMNAQVTYVKLVMHHCHGYKKRNGDTNHFIQGRDDFDTEEGDDDDSNLDEAEENELMNPFHQVGIINIDLFQTKRDKTHDKNINHPLTNTEINKSKLIEKGDRSILAKNRTVPAGTNTSNKSLLSPKRNIPSKDDQQGDKSHKIKVKPLKPHDIVKLKSRVVKLEQIMRIVAEKEDFQSAAVIKANVVIIHKMLDDLQTLQNEMRTAAEIEDYNEASKVKKKRDEALEAAINALTQTETRVDTLNLSHSSNGSLNQQIDSESRLNRGQVLEDLSLSTIRRFEEDDPSIALTMTEGSFQLKLDKRQITRHDSLNQSLVDQLQVENLSSQDQESIQDESEENDVHPLHGVPNYENLPQPDAIFHQSETGVILGVNSSNSSHSRISTDTIAKIESVLGTYRTRCFLSKNWLLREAAILKLSLMLPSIFGRIHKSIEPFSWATVSRTVCIVLEKAMDDKIVQVFLTGLILLDDYVNELEGLHLSQKETISALHNIIINLIDKMSSGNQKVVEGVETALMSLALYNEVGPSYIASLIMKRTSDKDSKGKLLCQRFQLLCDIVIEFGNDAPKAEKLMDFVKVHGFGHKDAEVREAAKQLTTEIFLRDGIIVNSMLDGLTERQMKEYKISFANAKYARNDQDVQIPNDHYKKPFPVVIGSDRIMSPNDAIEMNLTEPTPRGRRGRGRGRTSN